MAHPLIENYTDYFVVLARTDGEPPKDERFITRAFASSGFEDEDSGDEGITFKHEETKLTLACDGEVVVIHHPANGNYEPALLMFGDLFLALQRMGWESVKLHCANEGDEVLHQMASRLPATYSLDLSLAELEPTREEFASLRQTVEAHDPVQKEPSVMIGSLLEASSNEGRDFDHDRGQLTDFPAPAGAQALPQEVGQVESPVRQDEVAKQLPASDEQPVRMPDHSQPQPHATFDRSIMDQYEELLAARQREVADLHEIIKQLLVRQNMEQFAAAVLPHDAILIAHLYAPSTSKLGALGFEREYNVYSHEEYGVSVDGAFMVFTKDVAAPDWIEKLLNRLGGRILRVWQSEASLVGTLLEQRVDATSSEQDVSAPRGAVAAREPGASIVENINGESPVVQLADEKHHLERHGAIQESNASTASLVAQPATMAEAAKPEDGLSPNQRAAIAAMNATFATLMSEVFRSSNETQQVAERVKALEAADVDSVSS